MTHDNKSTVLKRAAILASRRTADQNEAIRRIADKMVQDFRDGKEPSDYPEGYGANMDTFLQGLSQKLHTARNENSENNSSLATTTKFRPRGPIFEDPFETQGSNVVNFNDDEKENDMPGGFGGLMQMAASAEATKTEPKMTKYKIEFEGVPVSIWQYSNNVLVQYSELRGDPSSIIIGNKEFFLAAHEDDPRFASISGLSIKVLARIVQ